MLAHVVNNQFVHIVYPRPPPQYNTFAIGGNNGVGVAGYDPINASPLGRVLTVGVRARF